MRDFDSAPKERPEERKGISSARAVEMHREAQTFFVKQLKERWRVRLRGVFGGSRPSIRMCSRDLELDMPRAAVDFSSAPQIEVRREILAEPG